MTDLKDAAQQLISKQKIMAEIQVGGGNSVDLNAMESMIADAMAKEID